MAYKNKFNELQQDHDVLYQSYINELTKNSKIEHAIPVLKRIANKLSNSDILCPSCAQLVEVSAFCKLMASDIFDKKVLKVENPKVSCSLIGNFVNTEIEDLAKGIPLEEQYSQIEFKEEDLEFEDIFPKNSTQPIPIKKKPIFVITEDLDEESPAEVNFPERKTIMKKQD